MPSVQDILDRKGNKIVTVSANDTVQEAASRMQAERIGAVLVLGDNGEMLGIFTERDMLHRVVAQRRDPGETHVEEVMTRRVACCKPSTTLDECRLVMTNNRIRHLPVVNDDKLVGMVSIGDVLAQEVVAQQTTIEYLHAYLRGRM
ncbi:MAG: CBS domain-containing protein [Phycisphaerae bacterium]|nr:CBS domain-containing protein [Phycisphaerae bacterium]